MVNPLSSIAGIALLGFAAAKPALVNVSPTRENKDGVHKNCFTMSLLCIAEQGDQAHFWLTFGKADALHSVWNVVQLHKAHHRATHWRKKVCIQLQSAHSATYSSILQLALFQIALHSLSPVPTHCSIYSLVQAS